MNARSTTKAAFEPHLTIKTRMSLWFTLVLAVICALLLVATATAYGAYGRQVTRAELVDAVQAEADAIEQERGYEERLSAGGMADAEFVDGDVQLMVYGEGGKRYGGLFLHDALDDVSFSPSDAPQEIELDGGTYYYLDKRVRIRHGDDYWVRGIVRAEASVWDMLARSGFLAALIPVLLLVAFFGGRILAGRFLQPVREIDRAAREIRESGDLTRRVPVSGAGGELSALAHDMNEMLGTLQRNFEAERTFASSASHELRTPVAVILAQCEYAEDNASDEGELRESIAAVRKQGEKMSGIIESLLMLTRIEQGTDRYTCEELDLSALVHGVCEDFSRMEGSVHLERDIADGVRVKANRELMELALNNLLRNAERYGGDGVAIRVALATSDGVASISVADDGPGIASDEAQRIWDLFYRADTSRSSKGFGLGLPLVRKIAEFHRGSATAETSEGIGSTFTVALPLA